jgi:hypothetical protein
VPHHRALAVVALAWLSFFGASARAEPVVMKGGWIATAGPGKVFRGRWVAEVAAAGPNEVQGTWTMVGADDQPVLEGTWAARKAPRGWKGSWSARAQTGGLFTGTWQAATPGLRGKTFEDLLRQTATTQIAGSWRMGALHGNWWLKG